MTHQEHSSVGRTGCLHRVCRCLRFLFRRFFVMEMCEDVQLPDEAEEETLAIRPAEELKQLVERWVDERHYVSPELTVEQSLKQIGISATELNYYLDHVAHLNGFRRWIPYLRIEESKRLMLEEPNYTLDAIAAQCGYSSRSTLSRSFKTQEGMAPSEWLKKARMEKR